jgi:GNAT superfamily N-acetyltransferase
MAELLQEAEFLKPQDYAEFESLYNDFKTRAYSEYRFELQPLDFDDFKTSVEQGLIKCIVLKENETPVSFLVYTTAISEAVELNIIHNIGIENRNKRVETLLKKFLELTKDERKNRVVCYPMLGSQKELISEVAKFGFRFIGIAVLRFFFEGTNSKDILKYMPPIEVEDCYKVVEWNPEYFEDAVSIVREAFENSSDSLFDPRFKTKEGVRDILSKITQDIYAEFLPEATAVILCNDIPVGFCFANVTGGRIANIPIVALSREHQGKGLSKFMLKFTLDKMIEWEEKGEKGLIEVNTCTETNNFQALKLYRHIGFKEDYNYPQAYLA